MSQPTLESLLEKVDCRYTLVVLASRRARQLIKDREVASKNPVLAVMDEIDSGEITYHSHY